MPRAIAVLGIGLGIALAAACGGKRPPSGPRVLPTPTVQVGACGDPQRDGVIGNAPRLERADRDLDGDGQHEIVVVDRAMCTAEGNCYWNVFVPPRPGTPSCARYAGAFAATALETLAGKGDDNMADVRGYWNLHGGRMLLHSYRFVRGGYQLVDALLCKRAADDKLDCIDSEAGPR